MAVDPSKPAAAGQYKKKDYYFCSTGCKTRFLSNPRKYLDASLEDRPDPHSLYLCPMHPEVKKQGGGGCPICGMALEPFTPTGHSEPEELADIRLRFWVSVPICLILFGSEMLGFEIRAGFQMVLAAVAVFWCAWPLF